MSGPRHRKASVLLVSDAALWIAGQTLMVDRCSAVAGAV